MSEATDEPRGAAAWQESRTGVAKRNLETRKRGQAKRKAHDRVVEARERALAARESEALEALNAQIARRTTGS